MDGGCNYKVRILAPLFLLFSFPLLQADEVDHCQDPEAQKGWVHLLSKHPQDKDVRALYNLRQRLCKDAFQGKISAEDGIQQFESARQKLMDKWINHNRNIDESREDSASG